uniref:Uncharacterized protein n=1 Tax=Nelumbo nucifera TaxID=4432 RepID=A0A822ZPX7_NELNU|nr:TPA_asm: hypothetical protein HUJ06_016810 [Nelumbo nucifera]
MKKNVKISKHIERKRTKGISTLLQMPKADILYFTMATKTYMGFEDKGISKLK